MESFERMGLLTSDLMNSICLKELRVHAQIVDFTAKVTVVQSYENLSDGEIQVFYNFFPKSSTRISVCGLEATIGSRKLIAFSKNMEEDKEIGKQETGEDRVAIQTIQDYSKFQVSSQKKKQNLPSKYFFIKFYIVMKTYSKF